MIDFCCEDGRRSLVREHESLNGIDHIEVVDRELIGTPQESLRQRLLRVFFVSKSSATDPAALAARQLFFDRLATLSPNQVQIRGGERIRGIAVSQAGLWSAAGIRLNPGDRTELADGDHLQIQVRLHGDHSRYTLSLVESSGDIPLAGLDPQLSRIDFSFSVECTNEFDCRPTCDCPPAVASSPELDYLAKDYASFRRMMLDRMAFLVPEWSERNPADLGVTLVELLAYVGDHLSYRQDAIAGEAYLGTSRSRVSVRRHARLFDYPMHDGCNARSWIQVRIRPGATGIRIDRDPVAVQHARFATRLHDTTLLREHEFRKLATESPAVVFEPMESVEFDSEHNEFRFYTWGDSACCLPRGATCAALQGHFPHLARHHVLIFVERIGVRTGKPADADPLRRHAVRLTRVSQVHDPLLDPPGDRRANRTHFGAEIGPTWLVI